MRRMIILALLVSTASLLFLSERRKAHAETAPDATSGPQFTSDGKLRRPEGYRRWVFVSSGYAMSYSQTPDGMQVFTNVFVTPSAYDYYLANGKWPDKTMFILEVYGSATRGSINKSGKYQDDLVGLEAEVKDESRFPDKWAYFEFGTDRATAAADTPSQNACWKCHEQNAAVEHSFVQFYPELLKIAREKGTIKPIVHLEK